jgi:hypothetical protein
MTEEMLFAELTRLSIVLLKKKLAYLAKMLKSPGVYVGRTPRTRPDG